MAEVSRATFQAAPSYVGRYSGGRLSPAKHSYLSAAKTRNQVEPTPALIGIHRVIAQDRPQRGLGSATIGPRCAWILCANARDQTGDTGIACPATDQDIWDLCGCKCTTPKIAEASGRGPSIRRWASRAATWSLDPKSTSSGVCPLNAACGMTELCSVR